MKEKGYKSCVGNTDISQSPPPGSWISQRVSTIESHVNSLKNQGHFRYSIPPHSWRGALRFVQYLHHRKYNNFPSAPDRSSHILSSNSKKAQFNIVYYTIHTHTHTHNSLLSTSSPLQSLHTPELWDSQREREKWLSH